MAKKNILLRSKKKKAISLFERGAYPEAKELAAELVRRDPRDAESWILLGRINGKLDLSDESVKCFKKGATLGPRQAEIHFQQGVEYQNRGNLSAAADYYRVALCLKPDMAPAANNLGFVLKTLGNLDEAEQILQTALLSHHNAFQLHHNMAAVLLAQGRIDAARQAYLQTLGLNPGLPDVHSDLVFSNLYATQINPEASLAEHRRWAEMHAEPLTAHAPPHGNRPDPGRRLRIGYVSPDFRTHAVTYFFEGLLANHDPAQVETYCYANLPSGIEPDQTTRRLQNAASHWRNISGVQDEQVAALMRGDGIDILVDLAGHTANNRLLVFARKPAPIQISYIGYATTTGLSAMDYRITDAWTDPPGVTDDHASETLVRLPHGFLCYTPTPEQIPVSSLPAAAAGRITFGSFNNLAKIKPQTIEAWSAILKAVPDSRLLLKNKSFKDGATCDHYLRKFDDHGVNPQRIELLPQVIPVKDHLSTYHRVDIALDTFPYNGTTTTCEAIWMGVPVVTLTGKVHAARVGYSLLSRAGLPDYIADSVDQYIRIAVDLAGDIGRLAELRKDLRTRLEGSGLCNGKVLAHDAEEAYRAMWRSWCDSKARS